MKKVFIEIGLVIAFLLFYFFIPGMNLALMIFISILGTWFIVLQIFLSISFKNWKDELSGRFHHLNKEKRLLQVKETFNGLDQIEIDKLRSFYINVSIFHFLLMIFFALSFFIIALMFLRIGIYLNGIYDHTISLIGFILINIFGYVFFGLIFPVDIRKNIGEIYFFFKNKDWQKKLNSIGNLESNNFQIVFKQYTFYDFILIGKTLEEKKMAFFKLIEELNKNSKNGLLFEFNHNGKIEVKPIIHKRAVNKTLAGFVKYCIYIRKILSKEIIKNEYRELLKTVFLINEDYDLVIFENLKFEDISEDYIDIYGKV